jgi:hypothetical protein
VLFAFERTIGGAITSAVVAKASLEPVLYLIPRLLSVTAGVLTIPVLYGVSKELFSRRVALVAAAFLTVAFLHVRDSHFGVTDVSMTFLALKCVLGRREMQDAWPDTGTGGPCGVAVRTGRDYEIQRRLDRVAGNRCHPLLDVVETTKIS